MHCFENPAPDRADANPSDEEGRLNNIEVELFGTGQMQIDTLLVPNPTFKVGLTNNMDLEVNAPTIVVVHTFNSATNVSSTIWGINDVFIRTKVEPLGK
jgi:hypothetical protein